MNNNDAEIARRVYAENYKYLKDMTHDISPGPGMYLYLMHGRKDPRQGMSNWGTNGPFIGPLGWVHITYNSSISIGGAEEKDEGTGPMMGESDPMYFTNDLLYYDGVYYGDWEVVMHR